MFRYLLVAIFNILLLSGYAACAVACDTTMGMTFTHYKISPNAVCANGRDSAKVMAEGAIIPQYDNPQVRATVQQDLRQIHNSGFGLIRTVLWFTQDRIIAPWGQMPAPLEQTDADKIFQFGADIKAAGFSKWMVVFSPGVKNSPVCKIHQWGDCWDADRTEVNIKFIEDTYQKIKSLASTTFKIEYDLSGEMCPSRYLPSSTNEQIENYVGALIKSFHHMAPEAAIHVSCGGFGDDRAALMLALFKREGIRPNAVDIHFYDTDPSMIEKKLLPAAVLAKQNNLALEIGEMQYENPQQAAVIGKLAKQHKICFSELVQWPRTGFTKCQMNVAPPFSNQVIENDIMK